MSAYKDLLDVQLKAEKEKQYKELSSLWINNFAPKEMHNSQKAFISADVTVAAMEPLVARPTNRGTTRSMHLLLMELGKDVVVRVFYNFNNKVSFDKFVGLNLCAFGETKEIKGILGTRDIVFSHIFTRKTGETVGVKVRATLVAFKVASSKIQLPYDISHDRYMDLYMDPYSDAISSVEILGLRKGQVGDYYEKEDLSVRMFPEVVHEEVKNCFNNIEEHLKQRSSECAPFLKKKLGIIND